MIWCVLSIFVEEIIVTSEHNKKKRLLFVSFKTRSELSEMYTVTTKSVIIYYTYISCTKL